MDTWTKSKCWWFNFDPFDPYPHGNHWEELPDQTAFPLNGKCFHVHGGPGILINPHLLRNGDGTWQSRVNQVVGEHQVDLPFHISITCVLQNLELKEVYPKPSTQSKGLFLP